MLVSHLIKSFKKNLGKKSKPWRYIHELFSSYSVTLELPLSSLTTKYFPFFLQETPTQGLNNPKKIPIPKATTCHLVPWNLLLQPNAKLRGEKKHLFIKLDSLGSHSTVLLHFTVSQNSRIQAQLILDFTKQRVNSLCLNTFVSHFVPIHRAQPELAAKTHWAPASLIWIPFFCVSLSSPDLKVLLKPLRNLTENGMCSHTREAGRARGSHKLHTSSTGKTCSGRGWSKQSSLLLPEPRTHRPALLPLQKLLWSNFKVLPQSSSSIQRRQCNHI